MKATAIAIVIALASQISVAATGDKQEEFKRFVGKWNCMAKTADSADKKGYTYEATFEVKSLLGGKAVMEDYKEKANKDHKSPYSTNGVWGYDSNMGKFTGYNVDNSGGISTRTSTGWTADTWTWDIGDGLKFVFNEKGGKNLSIGVEVKGKDGKWANVNNLTCKK